MRARLDALDDEMSVALPTSSVFGGIGIMLARFERESFLTSVPLLLLMTALGMAVFYFPVHDRLLSHPESGERRGAVQEPGDRHVAASEAVYGGGRDSDGARRGDRRR